MSEEFVRTIESRWADFDANKHLNNAVYLTYLEHLRDAYFFEAGINSTQSVLAKCDLTFIAPIALGEATVKGLLRCESVGNTSIKTREVLSVRGLTSLEATSVSVYVDTNGRPSPVPNAIRMRLESYSNKPN